MLPLMNESCDSVQTFDKHSTRIAQINYKSNPIFRKESRDINFNKNNFLSDGFYIVNDFFDSPSLLSHVFKECALFYSLPFKEKSKFNASLQSQFLGYRKLGLEKSTKNTSKRT